VYAASLKLDVYDTWGNLSVHGAAGFMNINKSAWGNMTEILPYLTLLITLLDMPAPVNEIFPE
jgi:hypothetical protein